MCGIGCSHHSDPGKPVALNPHLQMKTLRLLEVSDCHVVLLVGSAAVELDPCLPASRVLLLLPCWPPRRTSTVPSTRGVHLISVGFFCTCSRKSCRVPVKVSLKAGGGPQVHLQGISLGVWKEGRSLFSPT